MTATARELLGPTPQRLRHAALAGCEVQMPTTDRKVSRKNFRMVCVIDTMRNEGKIDDRRWEAWQRFSKAWAASELGPRVIQKYGNAFGGGGTPESQMMDWAFDFADARESRRTMDREHVQYALEAVAAPKMVRALVMAAAVECSLETIGKAVCDYADRNKQIAVARALIDSALWLLYNHYQRLHAQSSPHP